MTSRLRPIRLAGSLAVIDSFRRDAVAHFPKEHYGILIGHDAGDTVELVEVFVPEGVEKFCTTKGINVLHHWLAEADEHAREMGCSVVGDIHSHPYTRQELRCMPLGVDCSPSDQDLRRFPGWRGIIGLVLITESARKRRRSTVHFWGPMIPVEVELQ